MKNIILANKELNEWCGTKGIDYYKGNCALSSLFKYAVPKVGNMKLHYGYRGYEVNILKFYGDNEYDTYTGQDKDPALALFWAIYLAEALREAKDEVEG